METSSLKQYLKIKVSSIQKVKGYKLIQMTDVTDYVLHTQQKSDYAFNLFKTKNQVLSMINAQVSHELRNPLNSIIAKNVENKCFY